MEGSDQALESTVASRLKQARLRSGHSQGDLAIACRITQPSISDLERGKSTSSSFFPQIALALNVSPVWLATGEGPISLDEKPRSLEIKEKLRDLDVAIKALKNSKPDELCTAINNIDEIKNELTKLINLNFQNH